MKYQKKKEGTEKQVFDMIMTENFSKVGTGIKPGWNVETLLRQWMQIFQESFDRLEESDNGMKNGTAQSNCIVDV